MRKWINLLEADNRDFEQKLRDLIDHPATEEHLRAVAQRKLDKLLAGKEEQRASDAAAAEYAAGSAQVPAPLFQVNHGYNGFELKPLPREDWGKLFSDQGKKRVTHQQVIDALLPLGPFKLDFIRDRPLPIGDHVHVWFHPEDEPEDYLPIHNAVKKLGMGAAPKATYFRGGTSRYWTSPTRKR